MTSIYTPFSFYFIIKMKITEHKVIHLCICEVGLLESDTVYRLFAFRQLQSLNTMSHHSINQEHSFLFDKNH